MSNRIIKGVISLAVWMVAGGVLVAQQNQIGGIEPGGGTGEGGCLCPAAPGYPLGRWVPYCVPIPNPPYSECFYPSATIADLPVEPATVGYPTKKVVGVIKIPGELMCLDNPSCLAPWIPTIDRAYWTGTGFSPSAGDCILCGGVYPTLDLTPSNAGQLPIQFAVDLSTSKPPWSQHPAATLFTTLSVLAPKRLGCWRFNGSYVGEEGQQPLSPSPTNVSLVTDWNYGIWNYGALKVDSTSPPILRYRAIENDGSPNVTHNQGTIMFWFKPDWNSGDSSASGPGALAKLFAVAQGTDDSKLVLQLKNNGTQLEFITSGGPCDLTPTSHFTHFINNSWTAGIWHQIAVTYSSAPAETRLYLDGILAKTSVSGVTPVLTPCTTIQVGGSYNGQNQAKGYFDELETFNYPLTPGQISAAYYAATSLDSDNDGLTNLQEANIWHTDPYNPDTDVDGVLDGPDCFKLDPYRSDCGDPNDHTPPVIQLIQPVNAVLVP